MRLFILFALLVLVAVTFAAPTPEKADPDDAFFDDADDDEDDGGVFVLRENYFAPNSLAHPFPG